MHTVMALLSRLACFEQSENATSKCTPDMPAEMHSTTPCTSVVVVVVVDRVAVVVVCEVVVVSVRVEVVAVMVLVEVTAVVVVLVLTVVLDVVSPYLTQNIDREPVTQALASMSVSVSECTPIKSQFSRPTRA